MLLVEARLLPEGPCPPGKRPTTYWHHIFLILVVKASENEYILLWLVTFHFCFFPFSSAFSLGLFVLTVPNHSSLSHQDTACHYCLGHLTGSLVLLDAKILFIFLQSGHNFVAYSLPLRMNHNHLFLPETPLENSPGALLLL